MLYILNPKRLMLLLLLGSGFIAHAQKRNSKKPIKAVAVKKQKKLNSTDSITKVLKGNLVLPFEEYQVSMPYGLCGMGQKSLIDNPGITFKADKNAKVRAAWGGVVSQVSKLNDVYVVIIKCGELLFGYSNLSKPLVKENQQVIKGQQLAALSKDDTGNYTMDFLLSAKKQLNPTDWFNWESGDKALRIF